MKYAVFGITKKEGATCRMSIEASGTEEAADIASKAGMFVERVEKWRQYVPPKESPTVVPPPQPPTRVSDKMPPGVSTLIAVGWGLLASLVLFVAVDFLMNYSQAKNVMQQCALCAQTSAITIVLYVLCRCFDKIVRAGRGK